MAAGLLNAIDDILRGSGPADVRGTGRGREDLFAAEAPGGQRPHRFGLPLLKNEPGCTVLGAQKHDLTS